MSQPAILEKCNMWVKLENQKCKGRYFELSANKKTKENNKGNEKPSCPIIIPQ